MRYINIFLVCIFSLLIITACDDKETTTIPTTPDTPPVASFSVSASTGNCPFRVEFDASGSSDTSSSLTNHSLQSKSISRYEWDFGDGNSKAGKKVTHTYREGGKFNAKLTVTDNNGAKTSKTKTITVRTLTGGWKGALNWDGDMVTLKLYLIQDNRDLTGEVIWKFEGRTVYNDEITGRYKIDETIDMMWADKKRQYTSVIIESEPNKTFDRIDGRFYQSGFNGQPFYIKKVSDDTIIPAAFNELIIIDLPKINSQNRTDLLMRLKGKRW